MICLTYKADSGAISRRLASSFSAPLAIPIVPYRIISRVDLDSSEKYEHKSAFDLLQQGIPSLSTLCVCSSGTTYLPLMFLLNSSVELLRLERLEDHMFLKVLAAAGSFLEDKN